VNKNQRKFLFQVVLWAAYLICFCLSFVFGEAARDALTGTIFDFGLISGVYGSYFWSALIVMLVLKFVLHLLGVTPVHHGRASYRYIVLLSTLFFVTLLLLNAVMQYFFISRGFLLITYCFLLISGLVMAMSANSIVWLAFPQGLWKKTVMLVGTPRINRFQENVLKARSERGFRIITMEVPDSELTNIEDISPAFAKSLIDNDVSELYINVPLNKFAGIEKLLIISDCLSVNVFMPSHFMSDKATGDTAKEAILSSQVGQADYYYLSREKFTGPAFQIKVLMDFCLALLSLVVLAPLMAVIAVLIKFDSPGPMLFTQHRLGRNGRKFKIYKFRSMVRDAETLKDSMNLAARNEHIGPAFKLSTDPRITRIGKWLRRYSLDELPQLFNVLKGEMSLVGPRPPLQSEVENYQFWHFRRLSVMPGITGLWQVNGRNMIKDFNEWVRLDIHYINNWSIWLDLKILLKTLVVVFTARGAA